MNVPVLLADRVYHIGNLDRTLRGAQGESLEGHLLSVSTCPAAWRSIAKLGGLPLNEMSQPTPAFFLDMHLVQEDVALRELITAWGIKNGLAANTELWKTWFLDGDTEEWNFFTFTTQQQALLEVIEDGDAGPTGGPPVESFEALVGTPKLGEIVLLRDVSGQDAFDYVAMLWAHETFPEMAGVWWDESLDPWSLSAPRGGIFPDRIAEFSMVAADFGSIEDDHMALTRSTVEMVAPAPPAVADFQNQR